MKSLRGLGAMGGLLPPGDPLRDGEGNVPQGTAPLRLCPALQAAINLQPWGSGRLLVRAIRAPISAPITAPISAPASARAPQGDRGGSASRAKCVAPGGNLGLKKGRIGAVLWQDMLGTHGGQIWAPPRGYPSLVPILWGVPAPPAAGGCSRALGAQPAPQIP